MHQLQVFATVAELGSVRRAAEQLVVSQPAVSASIAALEKSIGVELVHRVGRGIELTEAGRTMERYARLIIGMVDEAVSATRFAHDAVDAPVRIGASSGSADHFVTPQLARLRAHRPALRFTLEVANRNRIWQLLAERSIDVAICSRPPTSAEFESIASRDNDMVLVAKPGSVWSGKLADATWLVREEGSGSRAATLEVIARLGIAPSLLTIGSNASILSAAESGLGVALLPRDAVADALAKRALVMVRTSSTPLRMPWHVVVRSAEGLNAGTRQFVHDLVHVGGEFAWTQNPPPRGTTGTR